MGALVLDYASVVDRLGLGGLGSQDGHASPALRVEIEHFFEREVACDVAVHDEDGTRVAAAQYVSEVVDSASCSQALVFLQISFVFLHNLTFFKYPYYKITILSLLKKKHFFLLIERKK